MPEVQKTPAELRAAIGRASRTASKHPNDPQRRAQADLLRRDYYAARLAKYVAEVVEIAPALTGEQRDAIIGLLNPRPTTGAAE